MTSNGDTFKKYSCRYFHNGSWWGLEIMAPNEADAKARVSKLGNLQLQGEIMMTIPAGPGTGILVRSICALRNFFKGSSHDL